MQLNTPAWPPTDWAYPEYRANIDAAPEQELRPLPVMVYDHSADTKSKPQSLWWVWIVVVLALTLFGGVVVRAAVSYVAWVS